MNSLIEVVKISKAKSSAGRISQRFNRMCARLGPPRGIWSKDSYCFLISIFAFILLVILQNPSKIIWLTCMWSKFVDTSFHSSQNPQQNPSWRPAWRDRHFYQIWKRLWLEWIPQSGWTPYVYYTTLYYIYSNLLARRTFRKVGKSE